MFLQSAQAALERYKRNIYTLAARFRYTHCGAAHDLCNMHAWMECAATLLVVGNLCWIQGLFEIYVRSGPGF